MFGQRPQRVGDVHLLAQPDDPLGLGSAEMVDSEHGRTPTPGAAALFAATGKIISRAALRVDTVRAAGRLRRMRITLIHALKHSIVPIEASFSRLWPQAHLMNLLDDSLSADLARDGGLSDAMTARFLDLGRYASSTGSDAILFTCSAFGSCIEAVARAHAPMPVLKPNEAMIEQAAAQASRVGLLSTFPP